MKYLSILIGTVVASFLTTCSSPNSPDNHRTRLIGTWEQRFTQEVLKGVTIPEDTVCCFLVTFTSRITFSDSTYQFELSVPEDFHKLPFQDAGTYRISGNTVTLTSSKYAQADPSGDRYRWELRRTNLNLSCLPVRINDSLVAFPGGGLFWSTQALFGLNAVGMECSGDFSRID